MHIVLGLLGTVVTILILLSRLADAGIDLGGLNPFLWARRRRWQKKYSGNPIFQIESPMEVTALLMAAIAKADGDMSSEEKQLILKLFQGEFHLNKRDAASLLISSTHILGDGEELRNNLTKVLQPGTEKFTEEQITSALTMLKTVAEAGGAVDGLKAELYNRIQRELSAKNSAGKWS